MSSGFSFPPPPPPPPKADISANESGPAAYPQDGNQRGRGGRRGQGSFRGGHRGNGQGSGGFGPRGGGGYSHGGARFQAQTPVTGVSGPHHYPAQLPHGSSQGYGTQSHPQWQPANAFNPAPSAYQHPSPYSAYSQPTLTAAQYPSHTVYNTFNPYHSQMMGPNLPQPGAYANIFAPQAWPQAAPHNNGNPQMMVPPMGMLFHTDRSQNASRNMFQANGNSQPQRHAMNSQSTSNKRRRADDQTSIRGAVTGQGNRAKTQVAPVVPSFGASLPKPPVAPSVASTDTNEVGPEKSKRNKKRKFNQLGLTPRTEEHEESEVDIDEEAAFGDTGEQNALQFEYRGQTSTLGSSTDIAAWIEQRRQRWPTTERVEEKKRAATQRAQEHAELRRKAHDSQFKEREQAELRRKAHDSELKERKQAELRQKACDSQLKERQRERREKTQQNDDEQRRKSLEKHLKKVEKLKRQLEKSEKKAAALGDDGAAKAGADSGSATMSSSSSEVSSDSETSDDKGPEERSSKGTGAVKVLPPPPKPQGLCKFFVQSGRCKLGDRCRFRHELPERGSKSRQSGKERRGKKLEQQRPKRKSLLQRLIEQEQQKENQLALEVVKCLGRNGFFEDDTSNVRSEQLAGDASGELSVDQPANLFISSESIEPGGSPHTKQPHMLDPANITGPTSQVEVIPTLDEAISQHESIPELGCFGDGGGFEKSAAKDPAAEDAASEKPTRLEQKLEHAEAAPAPLSGPLPAVEDGNAAKPASKEAGAAPLAQATDLDPGGTSGDSVPAAGESPHFQTPGSLGDAA